MFSAILVLCSLGNPLEDSGKERKVSSHIRETREAMMIKRPAMKKLLYASVAVFLTGCSAFQHQPEPIRLVTLDPGHFHAAVIQKKSYPGVSDKVYVYAPKGEDLNMHLQRIAEYNQRSESPTSWREKIYAGNDFLQKMMQQKKGNLLILAVNNKYRSRYISEGIKAGYHLFSDKPMAITSEEYQSLLQAIDMAQKKKLMILDMMSERHQVTNALQKDLVNQKALFGEIGPGSPENPAIVITNTHHFCKIVSGVANTRPEWYFDPNQQGVGIADVNTHLVDLVQWIIAGEKCIEPENVEVIAARRWDSALTLEQYRQITRKENFAPFLQPYVRNGILCVPSNGEIDFKVNGIYARVSIQWNFMAPEGAGDMQTATVNCEKGSVTIEQGPEQLYKPSIHVRFNDPENRPDTEEELEKVIMKLSGKYPSISLNRENDLFRIMIPDSLFVDHETLITKSMEKLLDYYHNGGVPQWEIAQLKTKYRIISEAVRLSE